LAVELAPYNIRVNSCNPGAIATKRSWVIDRLIEIGEVERANRLIEADMESRKHIQPLRMIGQPEDVGWACVYLASDEARYVTGTMLMVDGGSTALLGEPARYSQESLELIANLYPADGDVGSAALRFLAGIMKPWGMLFWDMPAASKINPEAFARLQGRIKPEVIRDRESSLTQAGYSAESESILPDSFLGSPIFPSVAHVIDPRELFVFSCTLPIFDELGMVRPLALPHSGMTLADTRSRKILKKYNLQIFQLFSGERNVTERISNYSATDAVLAKLDALSTEVEKTLAHIVVQTGALDDFQKDRDSCRAKVLYQIQNLQLLFVSVHKIAYLLFDHPRVHQTRKIHF
jgi:hypothetical protein